MVGALLAREHGSYGVVGMATVAWSVPLQVSAPTFSSSEALVASAVTGMIAEGEKGVGV